MRWQNQFSMLENTVSGVRVFIVKVFCYKRLDPFCQCTLSLFRKKDNSQHRLKTESYPSHHSSECYIYRLSIRTALAKSLQSFQINGNGLSTRNVLPWRSHRLNLPRTIPTHRTINIPQSSNDTLRCIDPLWEYMSPSSIHANIQFHHVW